MLKWTLSALLLFTQIQAQDTIWGNVDYIYWKIQNSPEDVPLVIQGPTLAVPPPVLGAPDTSVVLGGKKIDTGWRSGVKASLGLCFNSEYGIGTEINYFILPGISKTHSVSSDGSPTSPLLLVPFFNVVTGMEDSTAISHPLLMFEGTATLKFANKMQGAEWNITTTLPSCYCGFKGFGFAGFRYWNFREHLTFTTSSPLLPPVTETYKTKDRFSVENNFFGGQLGLVWECDYGCFSFNARGTVALGAMCERVVIKGNLLTNEYNGFGSVQEFLGGYFALPTNIGKHSQTKFAAIPELNVAIGYQLFDGMRVKLGYTFMYVSNMLWAGKQIDRDINPTQAKTYTKAHTPMLDGEASPKAHLKTASLWVQGLQAGIEFGF